MDFNLAPISPLQFPTVPAPLYSSHSLQRQLLGGGGAMKSNKVSWKEDLTHGGGGKGTKIHCDASHLKPEV
jgi:hypothetical protein